jgi:anti-sigma factor RsiW
MDPLLQLYLDGDLSPADAARLEARLAAEPRLEADLRAWESAMADLAAPSAARVSPGFADRVMVAVRAVAVEAQDPAPRRRRTRLRAPVLALAASLVFCFLAGYLVAGRGSAGREPRDAVATTTPPAALRVVRLVYAGEGEPRSVTVAGDFNAWRPDAQPLVRRGAFWSVDLALPPGVYEYMFVVDGERWVTDPLARTTRDDGYGGVNAILDLTL